MLHYQVVPMCVIASVEVFCVDGVIIYGCWGTLVNVDASLVLWKYCLDLSAKHENW